MMTEHYTYNRTWEEIHQLLDEAESDMHSHKSLSYLKGISTKERMQHMRDYKALQGVCNALRWVLGHKGTTKMKVLTGED
jgi:hypothetical protein